MTHPTLPPLPEPDTRYFCNKCGQFSDTQTHHRPHGPQCNYLGVAFKVSSFSRAEVESIRIATLEWAAQQADALKDEAEERRAHAASHAKGDIDDQLRSLRHHQTVTMWNTALRKVATAIRAAIQESKHGDE